MAAVRPSRMLRFGGSWCRTLLKLSGGRIGTRVNGSPIPVVILERLGL